MLPWRNSWFQIAFFAWLVSGALLIVDYAPKIPTNTGWAQAFQRAPKQPSEAPAEPLPPSEQQPPVKAPAPAQKVPIPTQEEPATKTPSESPSAPSAKGEGVAKYEQAKNLVREGNFKAALPLVTEACDGGNARACSLEGRLYSEETVGVKGITKDEAKAMSLGQKACDGGDPEGCVDLGSHYLAIKDTKMALDLFTKSCEEGSGNGCEMGIDVSLSNFMIGSVKANIPKDLTRALEFYKKSCELGSPDICLPLGDLYRDNTGGLQREGILVSPDRAQAIAFYRKACAGTLAGGNQAVACLDLKQMNATDKGISHDYAQSLTINRKYCDAKEISGCADLGIMYENGLGVPTDLNAAIALYTKACDGKNPKGCAALKRLGK